MKRFFKDKKKLMLCMLMMVFFITACKSVVGSDGKVLPEYIIGLDTTWGTSFNEGWFTGLFIWPITQLINFIGKYTDAGIAIIVVTFLINALIGVFSLKSQIAQQKLQMIQPEMNKIMKKYEGRTDDRAKMQQAQEMQALYAKYEVNPFGSILTLFIQLPVLLAVYQAVQRAEVVINGSFFGIDLTQTPLAGMKTLDIAVIVIFVLMVVMQLLSMKFPMWMAEWKQKHSGKKIKKYAQENQANPMGGSMQMMTYVSTAMIAFLSLNWPLGMTFYWLVSSIARILQNVIITVFFIKD